MSLKKELTSKNCPCHVSSVNWAKQCAWIIYNCSSGYLVRKSGPKLQQRKAKSLHYNSEKHFIPFLAYPAMWALNMHSFFGAWEVVRGEPVQALELMCAASFQPSPSAPGEGYRIHILLSMAWRTTVSPCCHSLLHAGPARKEKPGPFSAAEMTSLSAYSWLSVHLRAWVYLTFACMSITPMYYTLS